MDVDAYCMNCNSDQFTELDKNKHNHLRFCSLCWDWQKELPPRLKGLILKGLEEELKSS